MCIKFHALTVTRLMWEKPEESLLQVHGTEVEAKTTRTFTRSQHVSSLSEQPCGSREPYDQLVQSDIDQQGAGVLFQVDQTGSTYPQGRPTCYKSGRGQLSTQSRLRPLS